MRFSVAPGNQLRLTGSVVNPDSSPYNLAGAGLRFYGPGFTLDGVVSNAGAGTYYFDLLGEYTQSFSRGGRYPFQVKLTRSGSGGVFTLMDDLFTT